jgi:uncharacterized membrane protein (DUF2068 family)
MDWSLLSCGRSGQHVTYAPDDPGLRAQLRAESAAGEAWRCLRCGTFVPGPPDASGPAAQAPAVARGVQIRSKLILRVFAIERYLRVILFAGLSYGLWRFRHSRTSVEQAFDRELPVLRGFFRQLGYNIDNSKLVGLLQHALTLSSRTITLLAIGAALYAVIELVEGTGLWLARRWGEYFALVATSLGLPLEIYDISRKVGVTALVLLIVNLALVVYLLVTKRLFGIRGGKRAYDARLREESIMEAAAEAAQRQEASAPATAVPASATAVPAPATALPATAVQAAAAPPGPAGAAATAEAGRTEAAADPRSAGG